MESQQDPLSTFSAEALEICEKLFVSADSPSSIYNRKIGLIVNPEMLKICLSAVEQKDQSDRVSVLAHLSRLFEENPLNIAIFHQKEEELSEFNFSIFDQILNFVFGLRNPKVIQLALQSVQKFSSEYHASARNIKVILHRLAKEFHSERLKSQTLKMTISLLKTVLTLGNRQKKLDAGPQLYFSLHGEKSGLYMENKNSIWNLTNGFYCYCLFKIEHLAYQESKDTETPTTILRIKLANETFQVLIDYESKCLVAIPFGTHNACKLESAPLQKDIWYSLEFSFKPRPSLIFSKGCVFKIALRPHSSQSSEDQNFSESFVIPNPKIALGEQIHRFQFFTNFYGQLNYLLVSREPVQGLSKKGICSVNAVSTFLLINKKNLKEIFCIYSPLFCETQEIQQQVENSCLQFCRVYKVYDIISKCHLVASRSHTIPYDRSKINSSSLSSFGGLYNFIPLVYLLNFLKAEEYPEALFDICQIYLVCCERFSDFAEQAVHCQFWNVLSIHFNEIDIKYISVEVLKVIGSIAKKLNDTIAQEGTDESFFLREVSSQFYKFLMSINLARLEASQQFDDLIAMILKMLCQKIDGQQSSSDKQMLLNFVHKIRSEFELQKANHSCCLQHYFGHLNSQQQPQDLSFSVEDIEKFKFSELALSADLQTFKKCWQVSKSVYPKLLKQVLAFLSQRIVKKCIHAQMDKLLEEFGQKSKYVKRKVGQKVWKLLDLQKLEQYTKREVSEKSAEAGQQISECFICFIEELLSPVCSLMKEQQSVKPQQQLQETQGVISEKPSILKLKSLEIVISFRSVQEDFCEPSSPSSRQNYLGHFDQYVGIKRQWVHYKRSVSDDKMSSENEFQSAKNNSHNYIQNSTASNGRKNKQFLEYMQRQNQIYRESKRLWKKIWKRLRIHHYYWSPHLNQRSDILAKWPNRPESFSKLKFGNMIDKNGCRSILSLELREPWMVRKKDLDTEHKYKKQNYLLDLYIDSGSKYKRDLSKREASSFLPGFFSQLAEFGLPFTSSQKQYFEVEWIKHNSKRKGYLSILADKLKFYYDSTFQPDKHIDFSKFVLREHKPLEKQWELTHIVDIVRRRYITKSESLEIFFEEKTSLVFNFLISGETQKFLDSIAKSQTQGINYEKQEIIQKNRISFYTKKFPLNPYKEAEQLSELWKKGEVSNLKYLLQLNKIAGRSFLDPSQFPVVPWVIHGFEEKSYILRNLTKTIGGLGAQNKTEHYMSKIENVDPFSDTPFYQFGTHYSSPAVVFNFLIRLNPYTHAARVLQGGRFDLSDRLFGSLKLTWKSITNQISDVRELIPQFFYLPEILLNLNNLNLGVTQNKERIDDVQIASWVKNAYQFVELQRRVLESREVSEKLSDWIDLIFGYKQKDQLAEDNLNLYHYLTYENAVDIDSVSDEVEKKSIEAQTMHFGQTPKQLFTKPHPQKMVSLTDQKRKIEFIVRVKLKTQKENDLNQQETLLLHQKESGSLIFFQDYRIIKATPHSNQTLDQSIVSSFEILEERPILRSSSVNNLFHFQSQFYTNKVVSFGNGKYIAISSYLNGDLTVFSTDSLKKIEEIQGNQKSCIFVNEEQSLLICGTEKGLLEVFQIIYGQKGSVVLSKIAEEYYPNSISMISQNGHAYSVCCGSLVVILALSRSIAYIHDKFKKRGSKVLQTLSFEQKVIWSEVSLDPLPCVVVETSAGVFVYSINGTFLAHQSFNCKVRPVVCQFDDHLDRLLVIVDRALEIRRLPSLQVEESFELPAKFAIGSMKQLNRKVYLIGVFGQIYTLNCTKVKPM